VTAVMRGAGTTEETARRARYRFGWVRSANGRETHPDAVASLRLVGCAVLGDRARDLPWRLVALRFLRAVIFDRQRIERRVDLHELVAAADNVYPLGFVVFDTGPPAITCCLIPK